MALFVKSTTNRAVVIQGGQYTFEISLLITEGGTPADPDGYPVSQLEPTVNIIDPDGSVVAVGVGSRVDVGIYNYLFSCPIGAILSDSWSIKWGATISGVYTEWVEYFKAVDRTLADPRATDPNQLSSLKTEEYVLAINGRSERVFLETKVGYDYVQPLTTPVLSVYDIGDNLLATPVVSAVTGKTGIYYSDVEGTLITNYDSYYMMVCTYRLGVAEPTRTLIQTLWTAPLSIFRAIPDLRMLMDKAQKPTDRVQGYSDQEFARYLRMGIGIFNTRPPVTSFTWNSIPMDAYPWALTCAMIYGLKAQMLLEVDQDFEVTGQTISIRWEHFANLSAMAQQAATEWQEQGEKVKMAFGLGRGRLLIRPVVAGYIGIARQHASEGLFFESYKV